MSITFIKQLANNIYIQLGPGHSERIYHNAMEISLRKNHIQYETERIIPIVFEGCTIGNMRADLIIENKLIIELKSVKSINNTMDQQVLNYLKLTNLSEGVLINFPQVQSDGCEFSEVHLSVSGGI